MRYDTLLVWCNPFHVFVLSVAISRATTLHFHECPFGPIVYRCLYDRGVFASGLMEARDKVSQTAPAKRYGTLCAAAVTRFFLSYLES